MNCRETHSTCCEFCFQGGQGIKVGERQKPHQWLPLEQFLTKPARSACCSIVLKVSYKSHCPLDWVKLVQATSNPWREPHMRWFGLDQFLWLLGQGCSVCSPEIFTSQVQTIVTSRLTHGRRMKRYWLFGSHLELCCMTYGRGASTHSILKNLTSKYWKEA